MSAVDKRPNKNDYYFRKSESRSVLTLLLIDPWRSRWRSNQILLLLSGDIYKELKYFGNFSRSGYQIVLCGFPAFEMFRIMSNPGQKPESGKVTTMSVATEGSVERSQEGKCE